MAEIGVESRNLNLAIQSLAGQLVQNIQRELIRSRAERTPDESTRLRIAENIRTQGTAPVAGIVRAIKTETLDALRRTYQTTATLAQTAIETNTPLNYVLPRDRGYQITLDNAGRRVYNLAPEPTDETAVTRARAQREQAIASAETIRLMWVAAFRNSCPDCIALAGQVKTKQQWDQGGILPGNGRTRCGGHCQCHLAPVTRLARRFRLSGTEAAQTLELQGMLKNGVALQKKKIEELQRIRGEKYSEATALQKLGQIRSDFFNPNFEKRESLFKTSDAGAKSFAKRIISQK